MTNFSQFFELHETNFYLDCEEHIFDRISKNTYPIRMGLVSLWSRSENISYQLKLIFSSFWRNFIDCAWIWGCLAHIHQIRQFEQQWNTSGCDTKFISYLFKHSSFQKVFLQVVIFKLSSCDSSPPLEPATGESSNNHKMSYTHPNSIP